MNVDLVSLSSYQKQLAFVIPATRVRAGVDAAFKDISKKARLPGFRPGHAPRAVLEAKYLGQVCTDLANDLMNEAWRKAMADNGLKPVGQPKVELAGELRPNDEFRFTISVEVRPDVELTKYTGLDVVWPRAEVAETEVDAGVSRRIEQAARFVDVKDRAVMSGDLAMVELVARSGDEEVAREFGTMVRTAGDPYYPGLETLVIGRSVDESVSGTVSFGAKARNEAVAGRTLDVEAKIVGIQASETPPLTDELAAELGFEGGVFGMRVAVAAQLSAGREEMARNQARANLLEQLIAANAFDVPPAMAQDALRMLVEELRQQQAYRTGQNPKQISFSPATMEDLGRRSVFAAKAALLVERVAVVEAIVVTDEDVENKVNALAIERNQAVEAVRGWFTKEGQLEELRQRISEEKTLDWLLERANVTTPEPPVAVAAPKAESEAKPKGKAKKAKVEAALEPVAVAEAVVVAESVAVPESVDVPEVAKAKKPRKKKTDEG